MAMTLRLSDEDDEALERQARREGLSKQAVAAKAIRLYVAERDLASDVGEALDVLTPRYQRLSNRLGSV
ncbi:ribbon-helix-helix protein, CopG family [Pseudonocardia acaciae]|uniref:ribbon-helix-helix protein, CopG family n=1 Tax=Pseudonocardia acaciae TaxID=551276 RepID=UPI0005635EC4